MRPRVGGPGLRRNLLKLANREPLLRLTECTVGLSIHTLPALCRISTGQHATDYLDTMPSYLYVWADEMAK